MDHSQHQHPDQEPSHNKKSNTQTKDPVCGMTVDPHNAKGGSSLFESKVFYFCNTKCKTKFDLEPLKYT